MSELSSCPLPPPTLPLPLPRTVAVAAAVCGTHIIIHLSATCANFLCGFVCNCQQFARAQDAKIEINDNVAPSRTLPFPYSLSLCLPATAANVGNMLP